MSHLHIEEINKQLNNWIWPGIIAQSCQELLSDPVLANDNIRLVIYSKYINYGNEAGYDQIINSCLSGFKLSKDLIDLVDDFYKKVASSCGRELNAFSFSGTLNYKQQGNLDDDQPLLEIDLPLFEARILEKPLIMLTELIGVKAHFWRELTNDERYVKLHHLETTGEWQLPVYIDIIVGRFYGFRNLGEFAISDSRFFHRGAFEPCEAMYGPIHELLSKQASSRKETQTEDLKILDGFTYISMDEIISNGLRKNLRPHLNIISPYFNLSDSIVCGSGNRFVIDCNYGLTYNEEVHLLKGIYGASQKIPNPFLSESSHHGFLRIPFKKIPRISISSTQELGSYIEQLQKEYPDHTLLFRGQRKEYYVQRDSSSKLSLFGDANALEPSLRTTASRENIDINEFMAGWTGYLNIVLRVLIEHLGAHSKEAYKMMFNIYEQICSTYSLSHLSLSIAQHYGLPSHGLDVSKDYRIALSFALFEIFQSKSKNVFLTRLVNQKEKPVLYVFAMPEKKYFIDFEDAGSIFGTSSRPQKQKATFIYSGWGERYNDASRWLVAAFYLNDLARFNDILDVKEYFPSEQDDIFGSILANLSKQAKTSHQLREYLERLYWVQ